MWDSLLISMSQHPFLSSFLPFFASLLVILNLKKWKIMASTTSAIVCTSVALILHFKWDSFSIHLHQSNISEPIFKKILFLGDSITAQGSRPGGFITKIQSVLPVKSHVLAQPGATTKEIQILLENSSISFTPDLIIAQSGINDYSSGQSESKIAQNHKALLAKISNSYPKSSIWLLPIHPIHAKNNLHEIKSYHTKTTIDKWWQNKQYFVNNYLVADGIHLNSIGNTKLAKILCDKLTAFESQ
jgi:lysophospholipase L1-like esterase